MLGPEPPAFFLSTPHPCSYLDRRVATTLLVDPRAELSQDTYSALIAQGFRRSGSLVYRPHCQACQACIPIRIDAAHFQPTRSQRRNIRRNRDLVVTEHAPELTPEYFALYRQYQSVRHGGGSMDDPDPDKFRDFLVESTSHTTFLQMRLAGKLVCVAVVDRLNDGLSAIYTFFDPTQRRRGLGVYSILWEIEYAKRLGLRWTYLGYWIDACQKMRYKKDFGPAEVYVGSRWCNIDVLFPADD